MSFSLIIRAFIFGFMSLMKFKKDSSFQRIKASYLDETSVELTAKELEKKKRMSHAWGLRLNNKYSAHQTIQILMREYSISQATAYREYNMAMQIFGDLDETSLAAERLILKEALWNAYQKAVKQGNVELEVKALKEYRSLFNFDENENQIDPEKIQAHEYHIRIPRQLYKKFDAMVLSGAMDFANLDVEDIAYQEVQETQNTEENEWEDDE